MLQAEIAKLRSNCLSRQVGCVIVKDNRQISTGYNGTPSGIKNCFDGGCPRCLDKQNNKIKSGENLEVPRVLHYTQLLHHASNAAKWQLVLESAG